jgi:hypothetical protein
LVGTLNGNINKPLILVGGGDVGADYRNPGFIKDMDLINENTGNLACAIDAGASGRLYVENLDIYVNNIGVIGTEIISAVFDKVNISPASPGYFKKGYYALCRACHWRGGYIAGAEIAYELSGDDNTFYSVAPEFNRVVFKIISTTSFNVINCHFESFEVFCTNSTNLPFTTTTPNTQWSNFTSDGSDNKGSLNLIGCTISNNYKYANLIVIKSSPGWGGFNINITGCSSLPGDREVISSDFSRTNPSPINPGCRITIASSQGIDAVLPTDSNGLAFFNQYSNYTKIGSSSKILNGIPEDTFSKVNISKASVAELNLGSAHVPIAGAVTAGRKIPIYINGVQYFLLAQ